MINKKAQGVLPFNWIFAIVAGSVIIFLALFFVNRYVNIERYKYDTEIADSLSIILNPLETGLTSSNANEILLPYETRIMLSCKYEGIGREELKVSTRSSVGMKWQEFSAAKSVNNKYIFSRDLEQGKRLYVFAKHLDFPFYIADLIYSTAADYCFVNSPQRIVNEIEDINSTNMQAKLRKQECKDSSLTVCFGESNCDINVYGLCYDMTCKDLYDYGYSQYKDKSEKAYFYGDALMYGSIFSDAELYNCNIKRILTRISMLSKLYIEKTKILNSRGCMTGKLSDKLTNYYYEANSLINSGSIMQLKDSSKEVESANGEIVCKAW